MKNVVAVGVTGRAGSGKDSLALVLMSDFGFQRISFADGVYEEVAEAFGVSVDYLRDRTRKELPSLHLSTLRCRVPEFTALMLKDQPNSKVPVFSARRVLQLWGTEYRRAQSENYWIERVYEKIQKMSEAGPVRVVIPDVRFENEAHFLRQAFASSVHVVHIERPGVADVSAHVSENPVPRYGHDPVIVNDGELLDFKQKTVAWAAEQGL